MALKHIEHLVTYSSRPLKSYKSVIEFYGFWSRYSNVVVVHKERVEEEKSEREGNRTGFCKYHLIFEQ